MHRRSVLLSAASAALVACSAPSGVSGQTGSTPPPEIIPEIVQAAGAFDVALYHSISAPPGSQFVSPFSIASAFALLYPGARGQTAVEMAATFGFDPSPAVQAARTRQLRQALAARMGASELNIANAAWVERSMALRAEYARMVHDQLGAPIEAVDFIADQAAALERINSWVARETHNRIPQILTSYDESRRLVLTNAVYFKGKWSAPFAANATRDGDFHTASGAVEPARLMRQTASFRYFDEEAFQAAEFDYDNGDFGLALFLPRERTGLAAFERNLSAAQLDGWLQRLAHAAPVRLDVTLPKVELFADYDLIPHLRSLGLRAAFDDDADLSGVAERTRLAISAVVHKTFLAIDEEGTEAGAATAIDMRATAAPFRPEFPIEFRADHPFFIVLRHRPTQARLFLGRVAGMA